jgi:hypothetical protein
MLLEAIDPDRPQQETLLLGAIGPDRPQQNQRERKELVLCVLTVSDRLITDE